MPIRIKCQCGKVLSVRDEMKGRAVKCPGCGKTLRVPAATAAAAAAPAPKASAAGGENLDDLFAEEGFNRTVAAACPSCGAEMQANAVLCTKCGFNKQTGERLQAFQSEAELDMGTLALRRAAEHMRSEDDLQEQMLKRAGLPWWMLGLILIILVGGVTILTIAVNASKQVDEGNKLNVRATFFAFAGGAFALVSVGASFVVLVKAFQKSIVEGLLYLLIPPYQIYFWFKYFREVWRPVALSLITAGIATGLFVAASASM